MKLQRGVRKGRGGAQYLVMVLVVHLRDRSWGD